MNLYYFITLLLFIYCFVMCIEFGKGMHTWFLSIRENNISENVIKTLNPLYAFATFFFILFIVSLIGLSPESAYIYGTTFLVPVTLALSLICIHIISVFYLHSYNSKNVLFRFLYGVSSLVSPAILITFFSASIDNTFAFRDKIITYSLPNLLYGTTNLYFAGFAILSSLFFSAIALSCSEDKQIREHFLKTSPKWALINLVYVLFGFFVLRNTNISDNILNLLPLFSLFLIIYLMIFLKIKYYT